METPIFRLENGEARLERLSEIFTSSFAQLGVVLLLCLIVFGILRVFKKNRISFFDFVGLRKSAEQFDKTFFLIWVGMILFSVASLILQFYFSPTFKGFLLGETSPYGKILKDGFGVVQVFSGLLYCFVQSGGAEEVLFRGLFARSLFRKLGFAWGNFIQAFLFWIMHLLIFKLVTGDWISWIQVYAFTVSFGLGLILGYVNYRKGGLSIAPSWIIHGTTNFVTFLALGFLVS